MAATLAPIEVLCIYAAADERLRQALEDHVSTMQRQGLISLWHDHRIAAGEDRIQALDAHLNSAPLILLLISSAFLASHDCFHVAQRALERHRRQQACIVPILVRPVDWQCTPFASLSALPTGGKAVTQWQDQDEAWVNVAQGLRTTIVSLSPNASTHTTPWNIPFPRNPYFTGRDEILTRLEQALQQASRAALSQPQTPSPTAAQPHAISGLGGIGKTQIALEYAHRHRADYQTILWCRAETREDLISGYVALAKLLQLPIRDEKDQLVIVQSVIAWLETHEAWLLILDNADDLPLVQDFLPVMHKGHILLTTRAASMGRLAQCLEVETLSPEIGAAFVLRRAGMLAIDAPLEQATPRNIQLARELVQEMGGLPLALDQAGAYIEEVDCSLSDYLSLYRNQRAALLQARGGIVEDHPATVATTWSLSFEKVEQANPAAADLLRACAFLQPDDIPEEIFTEGASKLGPHLQTFSNNPLAFNAAIKVLRAYSLIRRDPDEHLLLVHRLVQAVLKDAMDAATYRLWGERVMEAINVVLPGDVEYRTWERYERCLIHALGCVPLIDDIPLTSQAASRLLHRVGVYLKTHARYGEAEQLYKRELQNDEQMLGPEHPDIAYSLNSLAILYFEQSKYAEAEALYERALYIREQSLGPNHPQMAPILMNRASIYYTQGKYAEAEALCQRALYIREQSLGPNHPDVASNLTNLANLYGAQGKYAEAKALYEHALHIREQSLGPNHPQIAYPLNGLANLYGAQGKYAEAEALYKRALHIWEQSLGPNHPRVASLLDGLAILYSEQDKFAEAEVSYRRAGSSKLLMN